MPTSRCAAGTAESMNGAARVQNSLTKARGSGAAIPRERGIAATALPNNNARREIGCTNRDIAASIDQLPAAQRNKLLTLQRSASSLAWGSFRNRMTGR